MSFTDEVEMAKSALAERDAQRHADVARRVDSDTRARESFRREVTDLWRSAEEYWNNLPGNQVDAGMARWAAEGGRMTLTDTRTPLPFPKIMVNKGSAREAEPEFRSAAGLSISDWFALCSPGRLCEIMPRTPRLNLTRSFAEIGEDLRRQTEAAIGRRYVLAPAGYAQQVLGVGADSSFAMTFIGPKGEPSVVVTSSADGPINVHKSSADGWEPQGSLRQLVIDAVAALTADRPSRRPPA